MRQPTSTEIAHDRDYYGPDPMRRQRRPVILPPKGMCFQCHREPVLPGESFGLKCSIAADLSWVEGRKLAAHP